MSDENKGFSMIELVVVIAIMAILVGFVAPVLIRYIEKSRESKDIYSLSEFHHCIEVAFTNEEVNNKLGSGTFSTTVDELYGGTFTSDFTELAAEVLEACPSKPEMVSKQGLSGDGIYIDINDGDITVSVKSSGTVVLFNTILDDSGNNRAMEISN